MAVEYLWEKYKLRSEKMRTKFASLPIEHDEHKIELVQLYERFSMDPTKGLTHAGVNSMTEKFGPNVLTPPITMPRWVRFLKCLFEGFSMLLWGGAVLCFIGYTLDPTESDNLYLGWVLITVVVSTGCFAYYQEETSVEIMESFKKLSPNSTVVIRNGSEVDLHSDEVCVGDLCVVKAGDLIPADMRIIRQQACRVDNSSLTGESLPQNLVERCTSENMFESRNMAFFGTHCVDGNALGVVINIGDNTFMGRIANITANLKRNETPIKKEIHHFIYMITIFAFSLGTILFILMLWIGTGLTQSVVFFISVIVANVPEGLLATVTVCLTLTAKRMAYKNCLVKNLESVETLGSTSVICSDKTGTLTQNRMTLSHLWVGGETYLAEKVNTDSLFLNMSKPETLLKLFCSFLAVGTNAHFVENDPGVNIKERKVIGDASEAGIIKFLETRFHPTRKLEEFRSNHKRVFEIPFSSVTKYHLTIQEILNADSCSHVLVNIGAPERILDKCNAYLSKDAVRLIDSEFHCEFDRIYEHFGRLGERVIGLCYLPLGADKFPHGFQFDHEKANYPEKDYIFCGLVSLIDPAKPGVKAAIEQCRLAGIRVSMVTGDHPLTAQTIASNIGLITKKVFVTRTKEKALFDADSLQRLTELGYGSLVMTGSDLILAGREGLSRCIEVFPEITFTRTSPEQKLMIVDTFQSMGHVVAVTGDGVNDSPALKKADIGIAMGISGSDVSKQAADMILLDDDFSSIVFAIEEGRLIFDNLKKSIIYTLTSNIPEMLPFVIHFMAGIPLPLGTITILCIDLGTDILPAISLAYESPEAHIMDRPPRAPNDHLVNSRLVRLGYLILGFVQAAAGFFTYYAIMSEEGFFFRNLIAQRNVWNKKTVVVEDYYGQEWNYASRMRLQTMCQTAFFAAIVIVQWVNLIICRTRINSLFEQRVSSVLCFSLLVELLMAALLVYTPKMNLLFRLCPILYRSWLYSFPYAILLLIGDEYRRYYIKTLPNTLVEEITFY